MLPTVSTLLLIDDTPDNLLLLSDILDGVGYRILVAENGEMGIHCAQQGHPDLVMIDIRMPGTDGYETCRRLKVIQDMCDVPILLTSAHVAQETWRKALDSGASDLIAKPFNILEVFTRVALHLKLRQLQRTTNDHDLTASPPPSLVPARCSAFRLGGHYVEVDSVGKHESYLESLNPE